MNVYDKSTPSCFAPSNWIWRTDRIHTARNCLDLLTWRCISSIGLCVELVSLCYITSMAPSRFSCLAQEPIKYPIDMNHQSDVLKVSSILLLRVICFSSAGVCVCNCASSEHMSLVEIIDPVICCCISRSKCHLLRLIQQPVAGTEKSGVVNVSYTWSFVWDVSCCRWTEVGGLNSTFRRSLDTVCAFLSCATQ